MKMVIHKPAKELSEIVLEEYEEYKNHLERDFVMKKEFKESRQETDDDETMAVLHTDWAEQHKLSEVKEVQSAFFGGPTTYDIVT